MSAVFAMSAMSPVYLQLRAYARSGRPATTPRSARDASTLLLLSIKRDESVHLLITELRCANFFQCGASPHFCVRMAMFAHLSKRCGAFIGK
jgi:hypothetical protein